MDSDEDSMVYILPHIPKTAGQTLRFHFSKHLLVHDTYIHLGPWGQKNEQQMRLTPWSKRSFIERSRVKVISGHNVKKNEVISLLPGIDIKFATFLRDPADRWISEYNFKIYTGVINPDIEFMDWYSTFQDKNYQVNWLYHHFLDKSDSIPIENVFDVVKGELLKFKLIGYVDNFEKDSTHLMRLIGLPAIQYRANVSGRDFPIIKKITPKLRQAILEDCEYDLKLINDLIKK